MEIVKVLFKTTAIKQVKLFFASGGSCLQFVKNATSLKWNKVKCNKKQGMPVSLFDDRIENVEIQIPLHRVVPQIVLCTA